MIQSRLQVNDPYQCGYGHVRFQQDRCRLRCSVLDLSEQEHGVELALPWASFGAEIHPLRPDR